jgi:hypothetical protein
MSKLWKKVTRALWDVCGGSAIGLILVVLLAVLGFLTIITLIGQPAAIGAFGL